MGDGVLISSFGNGKTPEEAIANYGREIHQKKIVVDGFKDSRRENSPVRSLYNN
jgi:hypothetical protein